MIFFPLGTDAPAYYNPITTIGLIVINVLVHCTMLAMFGIDQPHILMLEFNAINPMQWVTTHFMHATPIHLIGNMVFLWVFGIIIEGKIGWWKFLLLYLGICVIDGALVQIPMFLFADGQSREIPALGASGVIYGLMGISIVWAPANVVNVVYFVYFRFRAMWGVLDVPVLAFGGVYLLLQILMSFVKTYAFGEFQLSSEMLHIAGFVTGTPIGVALLWFGLVDCESYDLFTYYLNLKPPGQSSSPGYDLDSPDQSSAQDNQFAQSLTQALDEGHSAVAAKLYQKFAGQLAGGSSLSFPHLQKLVQALHSQYMFRESAPVIHEAISRLSPEDAVEWQLLLAQIQIERLSDPHAARAVLEKISPRLTAEQSHRRDRLMALVKQSLML